jgi:O-antigen/teichoic acid export membrane protein
VLQPVLARSFTEGHAVLERRYGHTLRFVLVVALPIVVIGAMTAWRVLPAIPGLSEFEGAGVALAILAPAIGFTYAASISQVVLIVAHAERRLLFVSAAALAFNLVLIAALIPTLSYIGAAAATTATEAAVLVLSVREVRRRLGLHPVVERLRPTAVAGAILVALLVVGYAMHPFVQVGVAAAGYVAALLVTRSVSSAELRSLLLRRA